MTNMRLQVLGLQLVTKSPAHVLPRVQITQVPLCHTFLTVPRVTCQVGRPPSRYQLKAGKFKIYNYLIKMELVSVTARNMMDHLELHPYATTMLTISWYLFLVCTMVNIFYACVNEEESRQECCPYTLETAKQLMELTVMCQPGQLPPPLANHDGVPPKHVLVFRADP